MQRTWHLSVRRHLSRLHKRQSQAAVATRGSQTVRGVASKTVNGSTWDIKARASTDALFNSVEPHNGGTIKPRSICEFATI
jgi:hypothetical protein